MNTKQPFSLRQRCRSFLYAFAGVFVLVKTQHNAWIHLLASIVVVIAGVFVGLTRHDWALIVIACALVWTAEALNTALEFLADAVKPEHDPLIKNAKDVAAAAVLIAAFCALLIGVLVFSPYL